MGNPAAVLETSFGTVSIELFVDKMPRSTALFLKLARSGFYDGTHFHRVIDKFMIQGGCPYSKDPNHPKMGKGCDPDGPIKDEYSEDVKISNEPGTIAFANSGPDTCCGQFFINTVHNAYLDWWIPGKYNHAVFGRVTDGLEVAKEIGRTPTVNSRPVTPVQLKKVTIREA
jgi:cyclophilin family peptidyl-prolyl cis-trans isomerase